MATSGPDDGQRAQELLERGAGLYEEGKLYEAISCWRLVLQIDPDNEIATEYLRFIEDNFQIGIDAFLEHHQESSKPKSAFSGNDRDLAAAIDDSINAILDESIEELDWAELLDDAPDPNEEAPPPSQVADDDEDFFAGLEPGSLDADPGGEAEAWGASLRSRPRSGSLIGPPGQSLEIMPEGDPFTLPAERFAAEPGPGDNDLDLDLLDELDDPLAESLEPGRMQAKGPARSAESAPAARSSETPRSPGEPPPRRDLADMSEESIDSLLDEDFKAWEDGPQATESDELPFESGRSNPPAEVSARPSQPKMDESGAPVERRRAPVFDSTWVSGTPDPSLQRYTGPLEPVDPRLRDTVGVERVTRTTPPTAVSIPVEAMAAGEAENTGEPALSPGEASPPATAAAVESASRATPAYGLEAIATATADPDDSAERRRIAEAERRAAEAEQRAVEAEQRAAEAERRRAQEESERLRLAAEAESLRKAESRRTAEIERAAREAEAEAAAAAAKPKTDLDDDLRALLTLGIAEIEAVESPRTSAHPRRLVSAPPPGTDLDSLMVDARRRKQADDFSGALELVEQVLAGDPNHAEARRYLEENTGRLLSMYRARLGSLGRTPRVKLRQQEIVWQSLDHREGFILSQVDGRTSFEEIIDISGMSTLESTRILARLVDHGVIG